MKTEKISAIAAGLVLLFLFIASHSFAVTITHEYDELNRLIRTTTEDSSYQVPAVQISANPAAIYEGESSTLTWNSTYATSCSIDQGIGIVDPNGSTQVSPTETTTYTITATGPGGTATDSVTVTFAPPPSATKLLLHCDGDDGSQVFTDDGYTGHTVTAHGNAQIDTAQKKFGSGSGLFDGVGDYLSIPDHADWNFGDGMFTFDFWVRFNAHVDKKHGFFNLYKDTHDYIYFYYEHVDNLYPMPDVSILVCEIGIGGYGNIAYRNWKPVDGVWYHMALIRGWDEDSNTLAICVDGTIVGSPWSNSGSLANMGQPLEISMTELADSFHDGWIDEFRVSKGVARWTSNFTPPD